MAQNLQSSVVIGCGIDDRQPGRQLGYDYIEQTRRRRQRPIDCRREDDSLSDPKRRKMISDARDLGRNSPIVRFAVNAHVAAVCDLQFHSRTGIRELDNRIQELYSWWSRPRNLDARAIRGFPEYIRLLEERAVFDGFCGVQKCVYPDGSAVLQAIEADRFANLTGGPDMSQFTNGVQLDAAGKIQNYCIGKRSKSGYSLDFEAIVPSWQMALHSYNAGRFDCTLGVTPLAPALATFDDCYLATQLYLLKAKQSATMGLVKHRDNFDDPPDEIKADGTRSIKIHDGLFYQELGLEEKLQWLESNSPASEFQSFYKTMVGTAVKSLSLPSLLVNDETGDPYASARIKLQMWYKWVETRRDCLRQVLSNIWAWRVALFVAQGWLKIPNGWGIDQLACEWVGGSLPAMNPLDEIRAACAAIAAGLSSPQRECKKLFQNDSSEIMAELAIWNEDRAALELPEPNYGVTGTPQADAAAIQK